MPEEEKSCEDRLDEFYRWCHSKIMEIRKPESDSMKAAKGVLKEVLPGGLGDAINDVQIAPVCPRDMLMLMPEFAKKLMDLLDNLCPAHASDTLVEVLPLLMGFTDVLGVTANHVAQEIADEKRAAAKHQNRLDEPNLN